MKSKIFSVAVIILCTNVFTGNSQNKKRPEEPLRKHGQYFTYDLFVSGENNVVEYRIPSIVTTNKGTLISVCDARVEKRGDAPNNIDLAMKKSSDGGKTWSKSKVIVDFPDHEAACDPSMVVDKQTGTIWLAYDYAIPEPQGDNGIIVRVHLIKSEDDGITWSSPVDLSYLTKGKKFWLYNGPGVGLFMEGVVVFPMYAWEREDKDHKPTVLVYSRDHGKTWLLSNSVGDFNVEPQIVSLTEGRLLANTRRPRGYGCRQVAITSDLGNTWTKVYDDTTLIESACQASLINYNFKNKSLLIFSNPADKKERKNMVVRVSDDEGESWQKGLPVYAGSAAYSCLTQLPNGNVGLLYEADDYNKIVYVEIPFQELY